MKLKTTVFEWNTKTQSKRPVGHGVAKFIKKSRDAAKWQKDKFPSNLVRNQTFPPI